VPIRPEQDLAQPDSLLRDVVENLNDVVYLMDLDGRLTYASPALARVFGISPAEVVGRSFLEILCAEDHARARAAFRELLEGRSEPHEYRVTLAPGPARWIRVSGRLMTRAGRPIGFAGTLSDVTEARRMREALAESGERYRRITERITDYIYSVEIENGRAVATRHGPGCETVTGYTSEDFDADPYLWISMIVAEDRARIEDQARRLTLGEERPPIEHRIVRKDGAVRWVRNTPVLQRDARDRPVGYDGLIHDITESKSIEEALRASEAALKRSQAVAHIGHWVWDKERDIVEWSDEMYRIFGIAPSQSGERLDLNAIAARAIHSDDLQRVTEVSRRTLEEGQPGEMEYRVIWPDGSIRHVWAVSADIVRDKHGVVVRLVRILQDITERRRAEEVLRANEAALKRSQEIAHVGHWIWNVKANTGTWSDEMFRLYGQVPKAPGEPFNASEIVARVVHPDDAALVVEARRAMIETGQVREQRYRVIWPDGTAHHLSAAPADIVRDQQGAIVQLSGIVQDITERQHAEETLRAREQRFRALIEHSHDAVTLLAADGTVVYDSPSVTHVLGYAPAERIGRSVFDYVHAEQRAAMEAGFGLFARQFGAVRPSEVRFLHKDGSPREIEGVRINLLHEPAVQAIVVNYRDVTERKRAERALRESERLLMESQRVARLGHYTLDVASGRWSSSPMLDEVFGIGSSFQRDVEGWLALIHPEDRERVRSHLLEHVLRDRQRFDQEYRIIRVGDGALRWVHGNGDLDCEASGAPVRMFGTIQDVTERRRAEEALRVSEEKFSKVFRSAPVWVSIATLEEGVYIDVNNEALRISGFSREEMIGQRSTDTGWISPENRRRLIEALDADGRVTGLELSFTAKDGRTVFGLVHGETITIDGHPCLLTATVDITERLQAEEARIELERRLLHAQKLESLGILAGGIAHDFNNLLMGILGNLDLTMHELPHDSSALKTIAQAVQATRRATDLTRQMLAYSGKGSFEIRRVDLNALVQENVGLLRGVIAGTTALNVALSHHDPAIQADPGQVQQVIMNLITNAAEAMGDRAGGVVLSTGVVECSAADLERSRLSERPSPGRFAFVEVADSGSGMDTKTQERLFDPFFTTKFTGRGLGMSAVLGIVRSHKGAIFVDSAPDEGTRIRVLFPAVSGWEATAQTAPAGFAKPAVSVGQAPLVLVVDDEDVVRIPCEQFLQWHGFEVVGVASGEDALDVVSRRQREIACVILDLTMPGMNGAATFREIKRIHKDARVILMSGFSEQAALQDFAGAQPSGFIQKPYRLEQLLVLIQRVINQDARA
jgi:two-component system, cell cycle sensor histidine kinase and response regulator CckA